jgi:hypothetical protein
LARAHQSIYLVQSGCSAELLSSQSTSDAMKVQVNSPGNDEANVRFTKIPSP